MSRWRQPPESVQRASAPEGAAEDRAGQSFLRPIRGAGLFSILVPVADATG